MTSECNRIVTRSPIPDDDSEEDLKSPSALRSPVRKVAEAFQVLLRRGASFSQGEEDEHSSSEEGSVSDTSDDFFVQAQTVLESPFIRLPVSFSEQPGLLAFRFQNQEWHKIIDKICVLSESNKRRRHVEITLDQEVFKSTVIKVSYDGDWFLVDIQTVPSVSSFLRNGIVDLIQRLFSCSLPCVHVFLRYEDNSCSYCYEWTGIDGAVEHFCHKMVGDH